MYLIRVVFPTPGGPITNIEPPLTTRSRIISALPDIARPTRQVRPIICDFRFRIALIRCNEWLIPDRLSSEKSPTCEQTQTIQLSKATSPQPKESTISGSKLLRADREFSIMRWQYSMHHDQPFITKEQLVHFKTLAVTYEL